MVHLPPQTAPLPSAPPLLSLSDTGSLYGGLVVVVVLAVGVAGVWFNFALLSAAFSGWRRRVVRGEGQLSRLWRPDRDRAGDL